MKEGIFVIKRIYKDFIIAFLNSRGEIPFTFLKERLKEETLLVPTYGHALIMVFKMIMLQYFKLKQRTSTFLLLLKQNSRVPVVLTNVVWLCI